MTRIHRAVLLLIAILAAISAAPATNDEAQAKIIEYKNDNDGSGNYVFSYETSNGIKRFEIGELVNSGQPDEHIAVSGEYSYIDADGKEQRFHYTADENGYQVMPETPLGVQLGPSVVASLLG